MIPYQEPGDGVSPEKRKRKRDSEEKDSETEAKKDKMEEKEKTEEGKESGPTIKRTKSPEMVRALGILSFPFEKASNLLAKQVPWGYNDAPSSVDRQTKSHSDLPIDIKTCSLMVLHTLSAL